MARKYEVYYDKQFDRLMLAGKTNADIIDGSVRILNLILDFNTEGKVVNAELLHASEYLNSLNLNSDILNKITSGKLILNQLRNGYEIIFILQANKKVVSIPYNVQLPTQKQVVLTSV